MSAGQLLVNTKKVASHQIIREKFLALNGLLLFIIACLNVEWFVVAIFGGGSYNYPVTSPNSCKFDRLLCRYRSTPPSL